MPEWGETTKYLFAAYVVTLGVCVCWSNIICMHGRVRFPVQIGVRKQVYYQICHPNQFSAKHHVSDGTFRRVMQI